MDAFVDQMVYLLGSGPFGPRELSLKSRVEEEEYEPGDTNQAD